MVNGGLAGSQWTYMPTTGHLSTSCPVPHWEALAGQKELLGHTGSPLDLKAYGVAWREYNLQDGFEARRVAYFMPCIFNRCLMRRERFIQR